MFIFPFLSLRDDLIDMLLIVERMYKTLIT